MPEQGVPSIEGMWILRVTPAHNSIQGKPWAPPRLSCRWVIVFVFHVCDYIDGRQSSVSEEPTLVEAVFEYYLQGVPLWGFLVGSHSVIVLHQAPSIYSTLSISLQH